MKRKFLLSLVMLMAAASMVAQDWTGRVYECKNSEELRVRLSAEMRKDPDFKKMSTEEQTMMSTLFYCMNIKMSLKFKKEGKVQTHASLSLDDERMDAVGIPWIQREAMSSMVKTLASDMTETSKYSISGNTLTIDEDKYAIQKDGKQLELTDGEMKLLFSRKK